MDVTTAVGGLFALIGAGLLVFAARRYAGRRAFLRTAARAEGTVFDLDEEFVAGDDHSYFPRIEFCLPTGQPVRFRSQAGGHEWLGRIGERVAVLYLPTRPEQAEIASFWPLWGAALASAILGVVFGSIGLGALTGLIPS